MQTSHSTALDDGRNPAETRTCDKDCSRPEHCYSRHCRQIHTLTHTLLLTLVIETLLLPALHTNTGTQNLDTHTLYCTANMQYTTLFSALEVNFNIMRSMNSRFTYLLTYWTGTNIIIIIEFSGGSRILK